ncbi:hypothetical protein [Shewanella gaetbuli]
MSLMLMQRCRAEALVNPDNLYGTLPKQYNNAEKRALLKRGYCSGQFKNFTDKSVAMFLAVSPRTVCEVKAEIRKEIDQALILGVDSTAIKPNAEVDLSLEDTEVD